MIMALGLCAGDAVPPWFAARNDSVFHALAAVVVAVAVAIVVRCCSLFLSKSKRELAPTLVVPSPSLPWPPCTLSCWVPSGGPTCSSSVPAVSLAASASRSTRSLPPQQKTAHEQPAIFYSIIIGAVGTYPSCARTLACSAWASGTSEEGARSREETVC